MPRLTTRDYKRSSRNSSAARLKEFGFGVLVGAVLTSAAFLIAGAHARHHAAASSHARDSRRDAPHAPAPDDTSSDGSDAASPPGSGSPQDSASAKGAAQAQQYDFYRMLPRFKVPVVREDEHPHVPPTGAATQPEAAHTPVSGHTPVSEPSYVLQVGSYRSAGEADQIRARLARAGISAQVRRIVEGSKTWNRVRIGPLSDAELTRVRERLHAADIHAIVIRADR